MRIMVFKLSKIINFIQNKIKSFFFLHTYDAVFDTKKYLEVLVYCKEITDSEIEA